MFMELSAGGFVALEEVERVVTLSWNSCRSSDCDCIKTVQAARGTAGSSIQAS